MWILHILLGPCSSKSSCKRGLLFRVLVLEQLPQDYNFHEWRIGVGGEKEQGGKNYTRGQVGWGAVEEGGFG